MICVHLELGQGDEAASAASAAERPSCSADLAHMQCVFDKTLPPLLLQALLPGAALLLMAQAAASQAAGVLPHQQPLQLDNASIPGPLVLPPLAADKTLLPSLCCTVDTGTGEVREQWLPWCAFL